MLKRIDLATFGDKIEWLWEKVKDQTYAFDDTVKGDAQAFLLSLFRSDSAHWYNESGMVSLVGIQPKINANIHFLRWDMSYPKSEILADARQVFEEAFEEFDLVRISATVPKFAVPALQLAVKLGMQYEGSMRECFLHEGRYHDLVLYGLLRREFEQSKVEEVAYGRSN